jgi:hypothetical protein
MRDGGEQWMKAAASSKVLRTPPLLVTRRARKMESAEVRSSWVIPFPQHLEFPPAGVVFADAEGVLL